MNEIELSADLIANYIAHEAVACNIIEKTPQGYVYHGDRNDFRIRITAEKIGATSTTRLKESYDLGYD